jgi:hypothetical protein
MQDLGDVIRQLELFLHHTRAHQVAGLGIAHGYVNILSSSVDAVMIPPATGA